MTTTDRDELGGAGGGGLLGLGDRTSFEPEEGWRGAQAARLAAHVLVARETGLYRGRVGAVGEFSAGELEAVLGVLPLTSKDELAAAGRGAWGVGPERVAEWVCTSGTLGKPVDVPLTAGDLRRVAENEEAALSMAGVRRGDVVILGVGMERLFVAGLAYWLGCQAIGAACVRAGPLLAAHAGMLREMVGRFSFGKEARVFVIAVPSFLARVEPAERALAGVIAIGEAVRCADLSATKLAETLGARFGCPVVSTYALTETCTTFAEGPLCVGGHLNPGLAIVECVGEDLRAVADGVAGEIVVTPLGVEGLPLLRFRTGDMAAMYRGRCGCGRTTPRVGPIVGRRQQLLKYRGTSVYPNAIVEALRTVAAVADCVVIADGEDAITVCVSMHEGGSDEIRVAVEGRLRAVLRVTPEIRFMAMEALVALQNSSGGGGRKAVRFIDRRGVRIGSER